LTHDLARHETGRPVDADLVCRVEWAPVHAEITVVIPAGHHGKNHRPGGVLVVR
jgi:hypothetical protein